MVALICSATAACGDATREAAGEVAGGEWRPYAEGSIRGAPVEEVVQAIRERLDGSRPEGVDEGAWKRVGALYAAYDHAPLWLERAGARERAGTLVAAIADAHTHGLRASEYALEPLRAALEEIRSRRPGAERLAEADLLLTTAYVELAEDMLTGQIDPNSVTQSWHIRSRAADVDSAIVRTLRDGKLDRSLTALAPQSEGYEQLRQELVRYRELVAAGGWQTIPDGPTLRPGDSTSAERIRAIGERLRAEGLLDAGAPPSPPDANVYDQRLAGAVALFQARRTIVVDSILGGETLEALNLPAEHRLAQIAANLERFRWLPRSLGSRYVFVNVPAFHLQAFDGGREALDMKVVVGAEYDQRATPAFADSMSYVVFRPYWNVPKNILENELLPKAAEDPSYFERNRFEWVNDAAGERVRQLPGGNNSLGLAKFMFPNQFAIYLHDTPQRETFAQDVRSASHGCIRVEDPAALAQFALGWDRARVEQAMNGSQDDHEVHLEQKIPVYIVYFTSFHRNGELHFGNDVYSRDDALVRRVRESVTPDAATQQALDRLRRLARS